MKKKHRFLKIAIVTFMVLFSSYMSSNTFAYWSNIDLIDTTVENVNIGEWVQAFQWDPNQTYSAGDQVINNGVIYTAKKDNPTREPGVDSGWNRDWA